MSENGNEFLGELRLGRRLTSWPHVAAGGVSILAGLLFLLPIPLLRFDGPRAAIAIILAGLVLLLSLAGVMELVGGAGQRGGTYTLVHEVLGGVWGFAAGWGVLAGTVALGAVLARVTAEYIIMLVPGQNVALVAVLVVGIILGLHMLQRLPRQHLLLPVTLAIFILLAIVLASVTPRVSRTTFFVTPEALEPLAYAVAWLTAVYIVFEAILASRRLVRSPSALLPTALLAAFVTIVVSLLAVTIALVGLTGARETTGAASLVSLLAETALAPAWTVAVLAGTASFVAANGCLVTAARQVNVLSQTGMLPERVRHVGSYFDIPPLLFALPGVMVVLLIIWAPTNWLIESAAVCFLIVLITLNIATIYSHRTEPDRRRLYEVPFYPLVPAIALVANGGLLLVLFANSILLLGVGTWFLIGVLLYAGYGRSHQRAAKEGVSVFGRESHHRAREEYDQEDAYRIVLPIDREHEQQYLLRLATGIAMQRNAELLPLQIIQMPDPLAVEQGHRLARERNTFFKWSTRLAVDSGVPTFPITRLTPRIAEGILDTAAEDDCELILLPWKIDEEEEQIGTIVETVVHRASCDVAVLAYRGQGQAPTLLEEEESTEVTFKKILVPTAGGPHSSLAGQLAVSLAKTHGATITVLNVIGRDSTEEEHNAAQERIDSTIAELEEQYGGDLSQSDIAIEQQVIEADSIVDGIATASDDHDLVLIGASEERAIERMTFGTIPEEVALASRAPVVIVKRHLGARFTWQRRFWMWVSRTLPQLDGEAQIEVYRQLRRDARPDVDFFVMIGLSGIIATFGLMQSSPAVIIGAMLVAPLFSPILGVSMAIIRGDLRLLRLALESTFQGVALAIGVALAFVFLSPLDTATPEIMARTEPNLFDLGVALASGAAGAYATARREMSAALPGVAIAAALVPPLGVVGFGLATGDMATTQGSGLLVATNLVAIMLAGALVFIALGFRPGRSEEREARLRAGLIAVGVIVLVVTIYLATVFLGTIRTARARQLVRDFIQESDGIYLIEDTIMFERTDTGARVVTATIYAERSVSEGEFAALDRQLDALMDEQVYVSFRVVSTDRVGQSQ